MFRSSYLEIDSLVLPLSDLPAYEADPRYRKATANMALATIGCSQLLERHPELRREELGFVLGTHFGEVISSLSYLRTQREEGLSRPNLFQNSLHNSTLGFTSIQLNITGPALTVSTGSNTVPATMTAAESLLFLCEYVLICVVDVTPEDLKSYYQDAFPEVQSYADKAHCWLWRRKS